MTSRIALERDRVLSYRASASHLDAKLPGKDLAKAAWGGLQDSLPRGGVTSLHARVEGTTPESWEDKSLLQIWFRGGADYIIPAKDLGIFTLGSYPRDKDEATELERLADAIERVTNGELTDVNEVQRAIGRHRPVRLKRASVTGRVVIRWDASRLRVRAVNRPDVDDEDARRELARRFLHWFGPSTVHALARWTGVRARDAKATWAAIASELAPVELAGRPGSVLADDLDALRLGDRLTGVRLLPADDPYIKFDHDLLVPDPLLRRTVLPRTGQSPGYIPGVVLVDGQIAGAWQRQQRSVRIHPFRRLSRAIRASVESEARSLPIPGTSPFTIAWEAARPGTMDSR